MACAQTGLGQQAFSIIALLGLVEGSAWPSSKASAEMSLTNRRIKIGQQNNPRFVINKLPVEKAGKRQIS